MLLQIVILIVIRSSGKVDKYMALFKYISLEVDILFVHSVVVWSKHTYYKTADEKIL